MVGRSIDELKERAVNQPETNHQVKLDLIFFLLQLLLLPQYIHPIPQRKYAYFPSSEKISTKSPDLRGK